MIPCDEKGWEEPSNLPTFLPPFAVDRKVGRLGVSPLGGTPYLPTLVGMVLLSAGNQFVFGFRFGRAPHCENPGDYVAVGRDAWNPYGATITEGVK